MATVIVGNADTSGVPTASNTSFMTPPFRNDSTPFRPTLLEVFIHSTAAGTANYALSYSVDGTSYTNIKSGFINIASTGWKSVSLGVVSTEIPAFAWLRVQFGASGTFRIGRNAPATLYAVTVSGPSNHDVTVNQTVNVSGSSAIVTGNMTDSAGHQMQSYIMDLLAANGITVLDSTGTVNAFSINKTWNGLSRNTTYNVGTRVTCQANQLSPLFMTPFTTPPTILSTAITQPSSGIAALDLTPQLVGTASTNYDDALTSVTWKMYRAGIKIGEYTGTSLNVTYDGVGWTQYTPLQYGNSYTVEMTVAAGGETRTVTKNFSIAAYTPIATITVPSPATTKLDTLTPTITATYSSAIGSAKTAHRVRIYNSDRTVMLGEKTVLADSSSPFSVTYNNADLSWSTYVALQWGTAYWIVVDVKDSEDIWSTSTAPGTGTKAFVTDSPPTAPTNLYPPTGSSVTTRQPTLSAQFNDPNPGDTPSVMEVQMIRVSDNVQMFQRTEADSDENFQVLLSDGLAVGESYSWRVRFYDQANLAGAWSSYSTFLVKEGVQITLTNPSMGEVFNTPAQTITWTYFHPAGTAQGSGRLRIFPQTGNVPIYDSGVRTGSYLSQELNPTLLKNNTAYRVLVDATDQNGDSTTTPYTYFSTFWTGYAQPTLTATPDLSNSTVLLSWNTTNAPDFLRYNLYKRESGTGITGWDFIDSVDIRSTTQYVYYFAPHNKTYDYAITVVEDSTGAAIESTIASYATATALFPYDTWIIQGFNPSAYRLKLRYNPARSSKVNRHAVFTQSIGRKNPVVHLGLNYNEAITSSFMLRAPYENDIQMLDSIIAQGLPVMYKDGRGRRIWTVLLGYSISDVTRTGNAELSLELQAIDVAER